MSTETGSSKTDTLVKVVLVFFISLLSFSVGTFVGKQVSDSDHRRLALEGGDPKAERNVASADTHHGDKADEESEDKISDKEIENLTEEFVNKERGMKEGTHEGREIASTGGGHGAADAHGQGAEKAEKADASGYKTYSRGKGKAGADAHGAADTHGAAQAADDHGAGHGTTAPAAKAAPKADAHGKAKHGDDHASTSDDAVHGVANKVAHDQAPTDGTHRTPASKPPTLPSVASSAIGKYTVQVASYIEESEAKTRAADLKGKGWNAFYVPAEVKGRTFYRVSVGLFENVKSADQFRNQFMREANTKDAIVQKVVN